MNRVSLRIGVVTALFYGKKKTYETEKSVLYVHAKTFYIFIDNRLHYKLPIKY